MICPRCGQREGNITFAESMLDHIHGFSKKICRQCYIAELQEMRDRIEKRIEEEKKALEAD